jgi:DNA-binding PadR family transcriptional regulator
MREHELILLGLLKESPKHGYEIKKKISEILSLFAGVDLKSIYYPLRILDKKGLVTRKAGRAGKRPARFVYALTAKGEHRFNRILERSLLDFKRPQFSLDLSLYFLDYMSPHTAKRRLCARTRILLKLARELKRILGSLKKRKPTSLAYMLEHDLLMVETEYRFLLKLIKKL